MENLARKQNKLLMQLLIGSESFFFLALIVTYLYYTVYSPAWQSGTQYLDIVKTSIFTLFLFASSITLVVFDSFSRKKKHTMALLFLSLTILFGCIFIIGQGLEYRHLFQQEILPSSNIFGSAFFTLTGFHGLHVIIGLLCLSLLFALSLSSRKADQVNIAATSISFYWHFVDVVWIFVFTVVYVLPYFS